MLNGLSQTLAEVISLPVVGVAAALLAGLLSSLAPCTFTAMALVLGFVGRGDGKKAVISTVAFFAGLTVAFVALGVLAQGLGFLFASPVFSAFLAAIVLAMGLNVMGIVRIPMPTVPVRARSGLSAAGAFTLGLVTATVSAPCATPVLIAVLAMASATSTGSRAILLTTAYALGHWAPVLAAGFMAGLAPEKLRESGLARASRLLTAGLGIAISAAGAWMLYSSLIKLL